MKTIANVMADLRDAEAAGFDFSEERAEALAIESCDRLAAVSEWVRAEVNFGPTVANQADYTVPAKVVRARNVYIGTNGYTEASYDELMGLRAGRMFANEGGTDGGVFTERFSEDGSTKQITLYPTPEDDDLEIVALCSITPGESMTKASVLPFPADMYRAVVDYGIAIAYESFDENINAGAAYLQRAGDKAEQLRRRANSRMGRGPYKARVAGHVR